MKALNLGVFGRVGSRVQGCCGVPLLAVRCVGGGLSCPPLAGVAGVAGVEGFKEGLVISGLLRCQ